ncbi:hypothetical protein O181_102288 [Austropuccinia psidii MF-1]|uniref:Uncharacterized protein n=1 Tax=Austropuccinia psidii MF-1 TaxID=1389203 RepID=A0A9Q3JI54_9BASI|nr:hypothetical protein [Austropuccinia psidii MF-1]
MDRCRKSKSAASTPERLSPMEYGKQDVYHGSIIGRNLNNESGNITQPNASVKDEKLKSQQTFHNFLNIERPSSEESRKQSQP